MEKQIIGQALEMLRGTGFPNAKKVFIAVHDAEVHLRDGLRYFCGDNAVWRDEYKPVADWLADNNGKGLLLAGSCGTGKSLIGGKIIPVILYYYCERLMCFQYRATEMNTKLKEIIQQKIIYIDDLGTETMLNDYGNRHMVFNELIDIAEREGKLLIISSNLDISHLTEKYGDRTMDRLRGLTKLVTFNGKSLRQ